MSEMETAICPLSIVPVRAEPNDRSEQVTQWLLGETAAVLERMAKWAKLKFHHDGYEGWADVKQLALHPEGTEPGTVRAVEQFMHVSTAAGALIVPFGAVLPSFSAGSFRISGELLTYPGRTTAQASGTPIMRLLALKDQWLNTPYLWGGRSPFGVDCSGFTQMLFLACGLPLQRDAWQQAEQGAQVDFIDMATSGDLAFFDNDEGRIIHVGIILGDRKIIHASGRVRVDSIDHQGIFNKEERRYTHRLRVIKRLLNTRP